MAFEGLAEKLQAAFQKLNNRGKLTEKDVKVAERALAGRGACRVHGGGFAGTIQAFVPLDALESFSAEVEAALGQGSCRALSIRPVGGTVIWE